MLIKLERYTQEKYVKLYYYLQKFQLHQGLMLIANELDYVEFIDFGYVCGCVLPMYIYTTLVQMFRTSWMKWLVLMTKTSVLMPMKNLI